MKPLLPPDYRPTENEPFMNPMQREYFRQKLLAWRIELLHYPSPGHQGDGQRRPMNLLGLTHLSFAVDDLDAVAEAALNFGGRVLPFTRATFQSGNSGLFLLDPDGLRIELIDRKGDPNRVPGSKSS